MFRYGLEALEQVLEKRADTELVVVTEYEMIREYVVERKKYWKERITLVGSPDRDKGISHSIRAGLAGGDADYYLFCVADQPWIRSQTILNLIHHREDCAQTALSQYLGVEPAAISKTLTKMEKKGLITRVAHPNTRGKFIELTEKGAQAHRDLSSAVAEHRRKALQGLSPEILQGLNDVMLRIQRNLSAE